MDVNYLISAHKSPDQVKRLVNSLEDESTHFYLHIDKSVNAAHFIEKFEDQKNVYFIDDEKRRYTTWGDIGITEANVVMLRQVIADHRTGYCVLMSGQDYPIKDNKYIARFFKENYGVNFIDINPFPCSFWTNGGLHRVTHYKFNLSTERYDFILLPAITSREFYRVATCKGILKASLRGKNIFSSILLKERSFPPYLKPFGGENWWSLPMETIRKLISFIDEHPDYLEFHRHTLNPEELFFQSIVAHLFSDDPTVIKKTTTYINWTKKNVALPVTFTAEDILELESAGSDYLFARKFDEDIDPQILDLIEERCRLTAVCSRKARTTRSTITTSPTAPATA